MIESIEVLGIPLYAKDIPHACGEIMKACVNDERTNACVSATGAHGMVLAQKDKTFYRILKTFYMNLPDGMPGVWVGRLKGARDMRRCYGPDFFKALMSASAPSTITHFFCGGNEGVADQLKESVKKKFSNDRIVGTYCPPFMAADQYDFKSIADQINQTKANVVWIGLSTPKQEIFAHHLSKHTSAHFLICVGAAFDFHTDRVKQAPHWIQRIGMEWFFRLCMEPARLYKRYLEIVPLFIFYNLAELLNFEPQKNKV